jgi:hypothetical protein
MKTVTLKGGVSVLEDVLRLCWDLEAKGVQFTIDQKGRLRLGPPGVVTADDYRAVNAVKEEVIRIVQYSPPAGELP